LALPIRSKNASFPLPPAGEDLDGASLYDGLPVRDGLKDEDEIAPPARDLRVACDDDGRAISDAGGGADGDQSVGGFAQDAASWIVSFRKTPGHRS
jgi:hypothetical protein